MDTTRFEVLLKNHGKFRSQSASPALKTSPTNQGDDVKMVPVAPLSDSAVKPRVGDDTVKSNMTVSSEEEGMQTDSNLSERFYDWMELDMEHGL